VGCGLDLRFEGGARTPGPRLGLPPPLYTCFGLLDSLFCVSISGFGVSGSVFGIRVWISVPDLGFGFFFGFRVLGFGFRVSGSLILDDGSALMVHGSVLRVQGSGFKVQVSGFLSNGSVLRGLVEGLIEGCGQMVSG